MMQEPKPTDVTALLQNLAASWRRTGHLTLARKAARAARAARLALPHSAIIGA